MRIKDYNNFLNENFKKTKDEFITYVHEQYPNDEQWEAREAMFKAYDFLTGKYDYNQKEINNISSEILKKLDDNI